MTHRHFPGRLMQHDTTARRLTLKRSIGQTQHLSQSEQDGTGFGWVNFLQSCSDYQTLNPYTPRALNFKPFLSLTTTP